MDSKIVLKEDFEFEAFFFVLICFAILGIILDYFSSGKWGGVISFLAILLIVLTFNFSITQCNNCNQKFYRNEICPYCNTKIKFKDIKTDKTLAIVGLCFNVILWPGLGTMIGGEMGIGIAQMIIYVLGLVQAILFVMNTTSSLMWIPILLGTWIWALITSMNQIQNSKK